MPWLGYERRRKSLPRIQTITYVDVINNSAFEYAQYENCVRDSWHMMPTSLGTHTPLPFGQYKCLGVSIALNCVAYTCQCIKVSCRLPFGFHGNSTEKLYRTYFGTRPIATSMVSKPLNSFINEPNRTLYARNRQYKCKKERKIATKFNDYRIEKIAQSCKLYV